jgi:DNA sulfur modification protein DndD
MIQLRRAQFINFRLLRNVEIEFSTSFDSPLTVIRAENDTGKTTLLTALEWGLFGDDVIPGNRPEFRMHPIDWSTEDEGPVVPIKVTIEFAALDEESGTESVFELERSCEERLVSHLEFQVSQSQLVLLRHSPAGVQPVDNPVATVASLLPPGLKDIFFINGDRAMRFIEATDEQRVKRERVGNAVRSLLGLDLLEEAQRHVDRSRQEAVSSIKKLGAGTDVGVLAERAQSIETRIAERQQDRDRSSNDRDASEVRHRRADKRLKEALAAGAGDQREIGIRLSSSEQKLAEVRAQHESLLDAHRRLINLPSLTVALAPMPLSAASELLADLEKRKVIPSTLPNLIEDRLEREECICGTCLKPGTEAREHLESLLAEARDMDDSKELLAHLNTSVKRSLQAMSSEDTFDVRLKESQAAIQRSLRREKELEEEIAELRARIAGMDQANLEELERMVAQEEREMKRLIGEVSRSEQEIRQLQAQLREADRERRSLEKNNAKLRGEFLRETAAKDILTVLKGTMEVLQGDTIDEVSAQMNDIFMAMIVADKDAGSIVKQVYLTRTHDIVVEGPGGRTIDPDNDLNGASQRALTLAFILALVKVSGVKAPNIIDTPLGMMGIEVRQAVMKYAAMHSSQLILFLTGSEILGVEDLIDEFAGKVLTLSNAAHYPNKLLNDPGTDKTESLICMCNHRQSCQLCARRQTGLSVLASEATRS